MRIPFEGCTICGGKELQFKKMALCNGHPLWIPEAGDSITWHECTSCGHIQTDGYFTDEVFTKILSSANADQTPGHNIEQGRFNSVKIVESVKKKYPRGVWVDIGHGSGDLLMTAKEYGYNVVGCDIRESVRNAIADYGVTSFATIPDSFKESVDVISMCDVIEHVKDPVQMLKDAHSWLNPNGVLFLSTPNKESALWDSWEKTSQNPYWLEIEHYHVFGRSEMYKILADIGFVGMEYSVSFRYRCGMEIICRKKSFR